MFYSKSTNGFYDIKINGNNIPKDAVEITQEYYKSLLIGQSEGKQIVGDGQGYPILIDPAPVEITVVTMRQARLALLQENQLDAVEAMITTPEQRIWWDYSTVVEKHNPLCQQVAAALNLDLTQLFELANTL